MHPPLQSKCIENSIRYSCPLDFHSYKKPVLLPLSVNNLEYLQKQFKSQCAMIKLRINKPLNKTCQQYFRSIEKVNLMNSYRVNYKLTQLEYIDKIIYNDNAHIVSVFKDYLIYDDYKSLLNRMHRTRESKTLLKELIKKRQSRFVLSTFWLCENKAIKKANLRKKKVRKIKEEDLKRHESESTLFRSTFLSKLAKEDLSNSISKLPTVSLECSCIEDKDKIAEILIEFNDKNPVVNKWLEQKKNKKNPLAKTKFSVPCTSKRTIKQKKVEVKKRQSKKQVPLNKRVMSCETQAASKEQESKRNIKPFSSNEHYYAHFNKKSYNTDKSNSGITSIRSFNKIAIELSSEIKSALKRESTLNPSLSNSKTDKRAFALSAESLTQINKKEKVAKKNNYFTIYNKGKNNCIKTPPSLARFLGNANKAKIVISNNPSKATFQKLTEKLSVKAKQEGSVSVAKKGEGNKEKLKLVKKTSDLPITQFEKFKKHIKTKK